MIYIYIYGVFCCYFYAVIAIAVVGFVAAAVAVVIAAVVTVAVDVVVTAAVGVGVSPFKPYFFLYTMVDTRRIRSKYTLVTSLHMIRKLQKNKKM